jgi:hypothetical protein
MQRFLRPPQKSLQAKHVCHVDVKCFILVSCANDGEWNVSLCLYRLLKAGRFSK